MFAPFNEKLMWQRKQTIFLALTAACLAGMIFFPVWVCTTNDTQLTLTPLSLISKTATGKTETWFPYTWVTILFAAAATVAVLSITKFSNRLLQLKLGLLNSILLAGGIFLMVYLATDLIQAQQYPGKYGISLFLPAGAIIFNMLANFFIRKDERMVRDADRLR